MLNLKQSDCRYGAVAFAAGEDLSLKTGYLAKLNAGGDLVLPQGAGEITPYVLTQGADQGYLCGAVPLTSAGNCRVKLAGSCEAGDLLVAKGDGRVEAGAIGGEALPVGTAEEKGIDGQHVLLRPLAVGAKGETGETGAAGADGADGAAGADGATGADGADGGVFKLAAASVSYGVESSAMAGKCVFLEAGGWTGIVPTGGSVSCFALVTGYSGGVFTCVFLGFALEESRVVAVPSAMVTGGGSIGDVVFLDSAADSCAVLGNVSNLYSGETWSVLAVGDGLTLLKKCYSAM